MKSHKKQRGFITVADPPPVSGETVYPAIAATRGGSPNLYQDSAEAATDRWATGQMDSCHIIGFDSGGHMDPPLIAGYIDRIDGNKEILAAHPTGEHYLSTYHNITEAFDHTSTARSTLIKNYLDSLDGPGTDDGWAYNSANEKVLLFGSQYTINNSHHVAENAGLTYPEWYADNLVQPFYIDPHAAAGVKIGGAGGINIMLDNFQIYSNKAGIDWNNDGSNDDAQDNYDPEVPLHVSTDPVAVAAYSSLRANMMKGRKRFISNNPGMWVLTNTNQWSTDKVTRFKYTGHVSGLRDVILEYRLNGDPLQGDVNGGFSEKNSSENRLGESPPVQTWPDSGVYYDGTNAGTASTWQTSYNNAYQAVRFVQPPGIVHQSWGVWCLQSGVTGPDGKNNYSHIPASNAVWNMARWCMCTAWMAGAYCAMTGIVVGAGSAGRAASTPHFDEYGIINTGTTGLSHKWMGAALEPPPTDPFSNVLWKREFENALIVINTDNNPTDPVAVVPVTLLPGGAGTWRRINGFQDPSFNDGSVVNSSFNLGPIDAIVLVRV